MIKKHEQSSKALTNTLIHPLPYRITSARGSGDMLSYSSVQDVTQDGVDYGGGANSERMRKPNSVWCIFGGGQCVIYIEEPNGLVS